MEKKYDGFARIAVAGGVAALGLSLGGVALATAADTTSEPSGGTTATAAPDRVHGGGPGGIGGAHAAELAEALGVDEEELVDALEAVRDELPQPERPAEGERPTPPTATERAEQQQAFAAALAGELDLTTATVSDALAALHSEREAEHRARLLDRLDEAVEAGDLSAADKASVLKAFDAGVLGGPVGGPGGR